MPLRYKCFGVFFVFIVFVFTFVIYKEERMMPQHKNVVAFVVIKFSIFTF